MGLPVHSKRWGYHLLEHVPALDVTDRSVVTVPIHRVTAVGTPVETTDMLAVEEPLEIRLGEGGRHRAVSVTMRTPGHDLELAVGFLFTEGIITTPEQVAGVHRCGRTGNVVRVELRAGYVADFTRLERHSYTTSSCGVCGKTSLAAVRGVTGKRLAAGGPLVGAERLQQLPSRLRAEQAAFDRTGGLHAAALFDATGKLEGVREDVGRHNALDKLIGHAFLAGRVPLSSSVLVVSGRASFELVQKAAVARIPVLAAVGAPSSLAVELARDRGMTLAGFVRPDRFNIYCGAERIIAEAAARPEARIALSVI